MEDIKMIGRFFAVLRDGAMGELEQLRWALISIVVTTVVGILLILAFRPTIGVCLWMTLVPWAIAMYRLFPIWRFIRAHILGEALEFVQALGGGNIGQYTETGIFDNRFIRMYISIIAGILFVQTSIFLVMPLYVKYTTGGFTAMILIAMLSVMAIIISAKFFKNLFVFASIAMMLVYSVGLVFYLFPQTRFYAERTLNVQVIPASTAQIANEIRDLQAKQLEERNNAYMNTVLEWQKANPGKEPPQWYKDTISRM